jgi:hypothetical protein
LQDLSPHPYRWVFILKRKDGRGLIRMLCGVEGYLHEQKRDANQNQGGYDIRD